MRSSSGTGLAFALSLGMVSLPWPAVAAETMASVASKDIGDPKIEVTTVRIAAGRLQVKGTANVANRKVRIADTDFETRSDAEKNFSFSVDYRTPDCRLELLTSTGALDVMIGNCGPVGFQHYGPWVPQRSYVVGDVVRQAGSSWVAQEASKGKQPGPSINASFWRVLAMRGVAGDDGVDGTNGLDGADGQDGAIGQVGAQGIAGNDGAAGPTGPTGATGADGPAGTVLAFADFYALMPVDNPATITPGAAIALPNVGPASQTGISQVTPTEFNLSEPGIYLVNFQVSVTEAGQLAVSLNGTELSTSVVGRATGTSQIVGMSVIEVSAPDTLLEIVNPVASSAPLTLTPLAGAASPVSAHLTILRLQ